MLKLLRQWMTGYVESAPLTLMSKEDAAAFATFNLCYYCHQPIDTTSQSYRVSSSSEGWTRVSHTAPTPCPPAGSEPRN